MARQQYLRGVSVSRMEIRALRSAELEAAWEIDRDAFHTPAASRERFLRLVDPARTMGAFDGARLVGLTGSLALGQLFGGRSVRMGGLSSVAVVPEWRGRGVASRLIEASLRAMHEWGDAISTLFPATISLYRAHDWEVAGGFCWRSLDPRTLGALPRPASGRVRPAALEEREALRGC